MLMPTLFLLHQQCARAGATLDYWQSAFVEDMPEIPFKSRDGDKASGTGELLAGSMVIVLSEHCIINAAGKTQKLFCQCHPELAPTRTCARCTCSRRGKPCVAVLCGCRCLCGRARGGEECLPVLYLTI